MHQKLLWKIEELWNRYAGETVTTSFHVSGHYDETGMSLYHPRFLEKNQFDPSPSQLSVFTDDYGSYRGLLHCQCLNINGKLVYIVDNHNEMLYPLVEVQKASKQIFNILHVDAHPDDARVQGHFETKDFELTTIKDTISRTRISDFFDAVSGQGIIGNIQRITDSQAFETFITPKHPYFLSLDIDIFGPEGDFVPLETKLKVIRQAWDRAEIVCIATSPGFIDQDFAQEIIRIICT